LQHQLVQEDTSRQTKRRQGLIVVGAVGVLLITGIAVAAIVTLKSGSKDWTANAVEWRARLFVRKVEGDIPELSWRDLWFMVHVRGGFGLEDFVRLGYSPEGTVLNPFRSVEDHQHGAQIFQAHCVVCHGRDGAGGYAPALNRPSFHHGDSDLAIYKIVRDGISGTGMPRVPMSPLERWQLIGYLRTLQQGALKTSAEQSPPADLEITSDQIRNALSRSDQWLTYSGSLDGHRYASSSEISRENVARLRVRWVHQFDTTESARIESTPIVAGGLIFASEPPSNIVALDENTGALRWQYRRRLPDKLPVCCAPTNRGLAILGNVLFMGSLDCYLVAVNASTGVEMWETPVCNPADGFAMTGAPLIVNDSVVVGVAGGEYGIRGFLAAYDTKTGQQQWRFNTIPGPGEFGHDTWKNEAWRTGGGPTWITGSYDPSLDLLYWGVGNPSPGLQGDVRPGDNLFTDSLIALHASSGKLAWYFQFTPHDEHDFDSTQTPILTDLPIKGASVPVLCVADRNGFYYVLDRKTGEFLLGVPFVEQNWAKSLNAVGRPILSVDSESSPSGRVTRPGVGGGTNWQNSAYDPRTSTIFVPATEGASVFTKSPNPARGDLGFYPGSSGGNYVVPEVRVVRALAAATGEKKWERSESSLPDGAKSLSHGYSGLLATGGGLVFGEAGGFAFAIDSATGRELWRVYLGGDTFAAPISFTVDAQQVVLISAGRAMFMFGL